MTSIPDSCSRCPRYHNLQRCSKCQSVWYCSLKCERAGFKSHKPQCQILEGSDPPPPSESDSPIRMEDNDWGDQMIAALSKLKRPPPQDPNVILGVKIHPNGYSSNVSSRGFNPRIEQELFAPTHEIFTGGGELCPLTESYGIPILICFQPITCGGAGDENPPAVDLCIAPYIDGHRVSGQWWPKYPGVAFVVRRDRKPLAKETVETMCQFHLSLSRFHDFKDKTGAHHLSYQVTSAHFREFSERYWVEEAAKLEQGRYNIPSKHPFIHRIFSGLIKQK